MHISTTKKILVQSSKFQSIVTQKGRNSMLISRQGCGKTHTGVGNQAFSPNSYAADLVQLPSCVRLFETPWTAARQPSLLSFYTVHGVLLAITLRWLAIRSSSGSHFVRTLHYDLSVSGGPAPHVS